MVELTVRFGERYDPVPPLMAGTPVCSFPQANWKRHRAVVGKSVRKDRAHHSRREVKIREYQSAVLTSTTRTSRKHAGEGR